MTAKLNYYTDENGNEYVVIVTAQSYEDELSDLQLQESVELEGDFTSWPTDRLLEEAQ